MLTVIFSIYFKLKMFQFNIFKKQQTNKREKLHGDFGYLSVYNLEDIFSFVGEDRIKAKIKELRDKATMGITKNLAYGKEVPGFYDKGPIDCMSMFLTYFKDVDIIKFLFEKLQTFNEVTYMKNSIWSTNRIKTLNELIKVFENRFKNSNSPSNLTK